MLQRLCKLLVYMAGLLNKGSVVFLWVFNNGLKICLGHENVVCRKTQIPTGKTENRSRELCFDHNIL